MSLAEELQNLTLLDPNALAFNPVGEKARIRATFDKVPRCLVRVFTPRSASSTDERWAKSRDARYNNAHSTTDIFMRADNQISYMLNIHIRWQGRYGEPDNFTSWTSSWLLALQYIFYLHKSSSDASDFGDIKFCIIDTTLFPKGCFLRDMDLIQAYKPFNSGLKDFSKLRSEIHWKYTGSYYFGEYLSQGALKIEDKCKIVSAKAILGKGLLILQPLFCEFEHWEVMEKPPWANEVIRLRETFFNTASEIQNATDVQIQVSINIAELFGPHFRLPMAAGLLGLFPQRADDAAIPLAFRSEPFTDVERRQCSHFQNVPDYRFLPEVNQFQHTMTSIYKDFCFQRMQNLDDHISETEAALRLSYRYILEKDVLHAERLPRGPGYRGFASVLNGLNTIVFLSKSIKKDPLDNLEVVQRD